MKTNFAFIVAHAFEHAIRFMCRVMGVTRSCYDAWRCPAPGRAERAAWCYSLVAEIKAIFFLSRRRYGAPRIPLNQGAELRDRGFRISKRTVARLMQEKGIRPPRGRRRMPITTDSRHVHAIAPDLLEQKVRCRYAGQGLGCRHIVHADGRRLALPRRRPLAGIAATTA